MIPVETQPAATEPKRLYRLVEPSYADLPECESAELYAAVLERTRDRFGRDCRIEGGVVACRDGAGWRRVAGSEHALVARLAGLSPAEQEAFQADRVFFSDLPFPAALWLLGARREWAVAFRLSEPPDEGRALLFQMARLVVEHRVLEAGWTGVLDRARAIQRSLLPDLLPELPGFELAARSESADAVGGDVYDAISYAPAALGLMIADASGHGLPAALEARDVVVGLRMGAEQHLKIDATIARLNRILCASTLSSRFVSLVYGELGRSGSFDYINAGHPAPLVLTRRGATSLPESGRVLGVSPDSTYRVGHAQVLPGGLLLLYTDGVTECPSPDGEEFGIERLAGMTQLLLDSPAAHIVATIFDALAEHAGREKPPDDASLFVIRRLA